MMSGRDEDQPGSGSGSGSDSGAGSGSGSGSGFDSGVEDLDKTVMAERAASLDETVVAARPVVGDETIAVPRDETVAVQRGETVAIPRDPAGDAEKTVMVERAEAADSDETIMAERAIPQVADETIVADRRMWAAASEETVMSDRAKPPSSVSQSASRSSSQSAVPSTSQSFSGSVAPPVEEPPTGSSSRSLRSPRRVRHDALDPMRRIAPAPWKSEVTSEPGVRPGLPVTYGPRYDSIDGLPADIDEVTRSIGPPPLPLAPPAPVDRSDLPSLRKRARRRNIVTLSSYAGAMVLCIGGLYVVWQLAFG